MERAIIVKNLPYCRKCEKRLSLTSKEVFLVECENTKYFEFIRSCEKCNDYYNYYVDIDCDTRYTLLNKDIKRFGRLDEVTGMRCSND